MTNNNSGYVDHLLASFHPLSQSLQTAGPAWLGNSFPDSPCRNRTRFHLRSTSSFFKAVLCIPRMDSNPGDENRTFRTSMAYLLRVRSRDLRKNLLLNVYSRKLLITAPRDITTDKVDVLQSCGSTELWNGFSFLSPQHRSDTKFNFFPDYFAVCSSTAQKILHKNPPALMRCEWKYDKDWQNDNIICTNVMRHHPSSSTSMTAAAARVELGGVKFWINFLNIFFYRTSCSKTNMKNDRPLGCKILWI